MNKSLKTGNRKPNTGERNEVVGKRYGFEKLIVWQKSMEFCEKVYTLTNKFPKTEQFGLTSQFRRASYSIPLNIAEGAASKTKKEFRHFLNIARKSQYECITIIKLCLKLKLINENEYEILFEKCDELGRLLNALIKSQKTDMNKKTGNRQLETGD